MNSTSMEIDSEMESKSVVTTDQISVPVQYELFTKRQMSFRQWQSKCKQIRQLSTSISGPIISTNFLKRIFQSPDYLVVASVEQVKHNMRSTVKKCKTIVGTAVLHILDESFDDILLKPDESVLYIDLLCSSVKGLGVKLMQVVEQVAKNEKFTKLQLSALPYVINYYKKLGFIFTHTRQEFVPITRMYTNHPDLIQLKFENDEDAIKHRQFYKLLEKLKDNGFAHDLGTGSINDATEDGFLMTKYLDVL